MGRDTYYTYEELYNQYKNRQKMFNKPVLEFEEWVYKYNKLSEEIYEELIERHRRILNTAETGRF